jgi:transcriptional regulator with XRE-family HTH domain
MTPESLARKLRILRAERGITLYEAEELTGVTRETLGALEHGQRGAYTSTLEKIAKGYGVTVGDLMAEDEPALAGASGPKAEVPASEASRSRVRLGQLHPEEGPRVTAEQLRELVGIEANSSVVAVLNQMLSYREKPTGEIHAYGYVKKPGEDVDLEQIEHMLMLAYLLATGAISEDDLRAPREALAEIKELVGEAS